LDRVHCIDLRGWQAGIPLRWQDRKLIAWNGTTLPIWPHQLVSTNSSVSFQKKQSRAVLKAETTLGTEDCQCIVAICYTLFETLLLRVLDCLTSSTSFLISWAASVLLRWLPVVVRRWISLDCLFLEEDVYPVDHRICFVRGSSLGRTVGSSSKRFVNLSTSSRMYGMIISSIVFITDDPESTSDG
jgi:hypothetical protein